MKHTIIFLLMAVPLIVCSQEVSYQYDANGNRIGRRIVAKKMNNNNINPSDSTILANVMKIF